MEKKPFLDHTELLFNYHVVLPGQRYVAGVTLHPSHPIRLT